MKKIITLTLAFILYIICFVIDNETRHEYRVLEVVDGSKFYIDLNNNGKKDKDELVHVKNIVTFPVKYTDRIEEQAKKFDLLAQEAIKVGFLAKKFSKEKLEGKYVKIKNSELDEYNQKYSYRFAKIYFEEKDYATVLLDNGFAIAYRKEGHINPYVARENKKKIKENSKKETVEYFIFDERLKTLHKPTCKELSKTNKFQIVTKGTFNKRHRKCETCINFQSKETISKLKTSPTHFKKGDITLYVNNPNYFQYPSQMAKSEVCRFLVSEINKAQKSVDFSIYGIDSQIEFSQALNDAIKRNIIVRGVSDSDEYNEPTYLDMSKLDKDIKISYDNSKYIMHNKFFIVDDKFLTTGSMNISKTGCGGYNANSVVVIENEEIIAAYKKEFEQMYSGKFKKDKKDYSTPLIEAKEGVKLSAHFSPNGNIYDNVILKEVKNANKNINLSIFVLTHKGLVQELIAAKERGVNVRIIVDAVGANRYKDIIESLRSNGIKTKVENWGGKNHEKTISIDDDTLIIGSANFSYNAIMRNDENLIRIKDRDLTTFYNKFFNDLYDSIDDKYLKLTPRAESFESGNSCYDGIDNDFDGKFDSKDKGCIKS